MAAVLTIGTLAEGVTGLSITGTISGGTGIGYGPASGVTGITIKATVGGVVNVYPTASVTILGTTITITTEVPVPAAATTLTLDITVGSNLTDSGANTATGQTGTTITNGSTVTFTTLSLSGSSAAFISGQQQTGTAFSRAYLGLTFNGQIDFTWTVPGGETQALSMTALLGGTGIAYQVSIDGGAYANATSIPAGNVWHTILLSAGLTAGAHTVSVKLPSAGDSYVFKFDSTLFLRATFGTTQGAISAPSAASFGTQYPLANGTPAYISLESGAVALSALSGTVLDVGRSGNAYPDARFRFRSNATTIRIYARQAGQYLRLMQDGVGLSAAVQVTPIDGVYNWLTVASGLSGTHLYEVISSRAAANNSAIYAVMGIGGTVDTSATWPTRIADYMYGDSIMQGAFVTYTSTDSTQAIVTPYGNLQAHAVYNRGYISATVVGAGATTAVNRITDITGIGGSPVNVWDQHGTNDVAASSNTATFQANCQTYFAALAAAYPSAKIRILGILPRGDAFAGSVSTYSALKQAAVTALANPNIIYYDTSTWIVPATDCGADQLHLTTAGSLKVVNQMIAIANAGSGGTIIPSLSKITLAFGLKL